MYNERLTHFLFHRTKELPNKILNKTTKILPQSHCNKIYETVTKGKKERKTANKWRRPQLKIII